MVPTLENPGTQVRRLESEFFSLLQTAATDKLLRSLDTFQAPIMLCDMGARGWPILHANAPWVKRLGALAFNSRWLHAEQCTVFGMGSTFSRFHLPCLLRCICSAVPSHACGHAT